MAMPDGSARRRRETELTAAISEHLTSDADHGYILLSQLHGIQRAQGDSWSQARRLVIGRLFFEYAMAPLGGGAPIIIVRFTAVSSMQ